MRDWLLGAAAMAALERLRRRARHQGGVTGKAAAVLCSDLSGTEP
jgi:hypothetical protein